jgi:energy-coupling factor transporter transmembrane protein EcfT
MIIRSYLLDIFLLVIISIITVFFIFLYKHIKKNNKKIVITSIVVFIISLMFILPIWYFYSSTLFMDKTELSAIYIGYSGNSRSIHLKEDLNLTENTIDLLNNDTLVLNISITNLKISSRFEYSKLYDVDEKSLIFTPYGNDLEIHNPKINSEYKISFHYIINSEYQEVKNIKIIGNNNYLNFSFKIDNNLDLKIKMDEGYENFKNMLKIDDKSIDIYIITPLNGDRNYKLGHVFNISVEIIYW